MSLFALSVALLAAAPHPVVVELFTSEGCSSCPPADEAVRALAEGSPDVIALGLHVDYWNRLGWTDPFSAAAYSERQERYQQQAGSDSVYTPHLLVNGRTVRPGELRRAVEESTPLAPVAIELAREGDRLTAKLTVGALPSSAELLVAVTERGIDHPVKAGENEGRTLHLAPVVRRLQRVAEVPAGGGVFEARLALDSKWSVEQLRVVAIVQRSDRKIVGAGQTSLPKK